MISSSQQELYAMLLVFFQDGDLQLWSLSDGLLLESMPFADAVTSVAIMHDEPFILLGCASGNVQVVNMLDSSGNSAVGAAPVHTMELQPFQGALFSRLCCLQSASSRCVINPY